MDVAIKYEKINLGDERFVFKPVSVIMGEYDEETEIFETEYGELCCPIDGDCQYEDNYFGSVTSMEELREMYIDISDEDILAEYFETCKSSYSIGYFDYAIGQIRVLNIPYEGLEQYFDKGYESYEPQGEDVKITFNIDKINDLRKTKDIKELYAKLDEIIKYAKIIKEEANKATQNKPNPKASRTLFLEKDKSKQMTLKELREEVKSVIKGQDKAVDTITRAIIVNQTSSNPRHKSHMLITGPSGTGKTEMVNIIAKKLGIPYFKADATAYTKEGYVGKSVYSMFNGLIEAAGGDIKKAQNGILIIDEIDKKLSPRKDDVGGVDVLNSLLKIMDREVIEIDNGRGNVTMFDASNLTIIFMGAFAEVYAEKETSNKKFIGFNSEKQEEKQNEKTVVTNEDLIKAGMPPEFLGRIPVVANTEELSVEDLVEILYKSKGGVIDEEKEYFKGHGITIKFTAPYLREIAERAHKSKTGARNLRKLVRQSLCSVYDDFLSGKEIKTLKITKKTAFDSKNYCAY